MTTFFLSCPVDSAMFAGEVLAAAAAVGATCFAVDHWLWLSLEVNLGSNSVAVLRNGQYYTWNRFAQMPAFSPYTTASVDADGWLAGMLWHCVDDLWWWRRQNT